ncbi:MAG: LON peptidase substrate-binding domain-containing protein [Myxococcota bacterium]
MLEIPIVESAYEALPVFPLPNFVIFPNTMTRLHIFEPRFRLMATEALATHRLMVLVGLKPGWEADYYGSPPVHEFGSLCKIVNDERLEDGRYNLFVHCLARVQISTVHRLVPYRTASVTVCDDQTADPDRMDDAMTRLVSCVRGLIVKLGENGALLGTVLSATRKPAILTNRLAAALATDPMDRQRLLELTDPVERAERLTDIAGDLLLRVDQPEIDMEGLDFSMVN